jgi:hypothetical protein
MRYPGIMSVQCRQWTLGGVTGNYPAKMGRSGVVSDIPVFHPERLLAVSRTVGKHLATGQDPSASSGPNFRFITDNPTVARKNANPLIANTVTDVTRLWEKARARKPFHQKGNGGVARGSDRRNDGGPARP